MVKKVSMLEFRRDTERIIAQVQRGQHMILMKRGIPVAKLGPIDEIHPDAQYPFYSITELAEKGKT
jgi:antitoxin (DNA-binding transcriptional repressor) of toxin-antitoxin stability system